MSSARDRFLAKVRGALAEGGPANHAPPLPARENVGYQGCGPDPASRFQQEIETAGGFCHRVPDVQAAREKVLELALEKKPTQALLTHGNVVDALGLVPLLGEKKIAVTSPRDTDPAAMKEACFGCQLGISGVDYLIAETGSVVVFSREDQPRYGSLLPPVHIAVADSSQLLADLFDLFALPLYSAGSSGPACISVITGPSKTGDIELRLVTGVHGPGEIHVVLIETPVSHQSR